MLSSARFLHPGEILMSPLLLVLIGMAIVLTGVLVFKLHAFLALIIAAFVVAALTPHDVLLAQRLSDKHVAERVAEGFGKTCVDIGILIALAAIVGECLLASGAAQRIVRSTLSTVGEKRAPVAFLGSGFLLGIPVFFDTVFYLLIPLGKAMRMRTGKNYLLYVLAIVAGATMTHSLVPPTPGPLYAASAFKVDVGTMILGGLAVSVVTAIVGFSYAVWANRRWDIPLRDTAEGNVGDLQAMSQTKDDSLPPLWLSLLPIVLPVVLIAGNAVIETWMASLKKDDIVPAWIAMLQGPVGMLGNKNIALLLAAIIAMLTQALWKRSEQGGVSKAVNTALTSGGVVILITAAGGAFGAVLRQTGIASEIRELSEGWHLAVLPLAFLVTTLVRTAQGSATVAMITAAGIFAPLVAADGLSFHPLYLALAVGCGSKPVMWMNDSGFWVITKMTGFKEIETLRTATVMMILMALAGLAVVMVGAMVMPMK